jgi:hypothetical protein
MFFDIGAGIFLGLFYGQFTDAFTINQLALFGAAFSLLPDADFIFHMFRGGKIHSSHRHRELLHNPIIYSVLGSMIMYFIEPQLIGLFILGGLIHFLHDSIGIGWGVRWLYPFLNLNYAFLYRVRTGNHKNLPKKLFYVWKNEDIDKLADQYGDKEWFKNTYLKFHPYAVSELLVFVVALITWVKVV